MIYIRIDEQENIMLVSNLPNINCLEYAGSVPDDFINTVGLGKYQFINNEITAVSGWTMPVIVNPITQ